MNVGFISSRAASGGQSEGHLRIVVMPSLCAALRLGPMSSRNTTSLGLTLSKLSAYS